jgi:hypothetical protein
MYQKLQKVTKVINSYKWLQRLLNSNKNFEIVTKFYK